MKPLDKHGFNPSGYHLSTLDQCVIFAIFSEIFTHVIGDFLVVKIPWYSFYKNINIEKKNSEAWRAEEHPKSCHFLINMSVPKDSRK